MTNGNKSCRWHTLRIAIGMMVLGLLLAGGRGAVSVDEGIKTFDDVNPVFAAEMALNPANPAYTGTNNNNSTIGDINVVSPNGKVAWKRGTNQTIRWNYRGAPGSRVKIELLKNGEFSRLINSDVPIGSGGSGSYRWLINANQTLGTDYKVRVTSTTKSAYTDTSYSNFMITGGIVVTSPNGGENWSRGTKQIIRWNYSGTPGYRVKIELLKNGRKNRIISTNTSNDGSYNWSINSIQTLGAGYKIRVKSTTNPSYTDKSNKNFSIDDFSADINNKLILVGVDGFSLAKYKSMYPQLKNFSNIVINGGWNGTLEITGHTKTTSAPGNAELMTGLKERQNGVSSNKGSKIVDGKTIWERLEEYNSSIVTGSVYGKKNSYITSPLFDNAIPDIDWWQDRNTYGARIWPCGRSVDYDVDVANKATEFIEQYNKNSFFLVVYFASPDGSGHYCGGDTGQSYTDSFLNVDKGLGILLNSLKDNGINTTTQIIITGDHGWNIGTTGHGKVNNDTRILPLITNNITMLSNVTSNGFREQGEVAPTILDFFGMTTSDYQDITKAGYQSMRDSSTLIR